jgi:hypothetical protein
MSSIALPLPGNPERVDTRLGAQIGAVALGMGLLADLLFNGALLGLNLPVWLAVLVGGFSITARQAGRSFGWSQTVCLVASLAFAAMVAWRDAATLQVFLVVASLTFLVLGLVGRPHLRLHRLSLPGLFWSLSLGVSHIVAGLYALATGVPWRLWFGDRAVGGARTIGRALLLTAPLLLAFGGLFAAADAVFQEGLRQAFDFDAAVGFRHLLWFTGGTWLAAGALWCGLVVAAPPAGEVELPDDRRLKTVEAAIILGSLAALFGAFVFVQISYLFGVF